MSTKARKIERWNARRLACLSRSSGASLDIRRRGYSLLKVYNNNYLGA
jgi:hypothetical protein